MAVTAQSIIDRARTQLIDTGAVKRWTDTELLQWLSDGQRSIVAIAPGASSTTGVQPLSAGTRQTIPADGYMLLNIIRNCDAVGTTPGRAVRVASRELIDDQDPDWHTSSTSATVRNYIFDPQEPKVFYVYPPNNGTGFVQMIYSVLPPEVAELTDEISVTELYQTPLVDYVLFRAYQKDSDFGTGSAQAQTYLQLFMSFMGQGEASQLAANPNLQLSPPDPTSKGTAK
jgi:hypothetical protein